MIGSRWATLFPLQSAEHQLWSTELLLYKFHANLKTNCTAQSWFKQHIVVPQPDHLGLQKCCSSLNQSMCLLSLVPPGTQPSESSCEGHASTENTVQPVIAGSRCANIDRMKKPDSIQTHTPFLFVFIDTGCVWVKWRLVRYWTLNLRRNNDLFAA